jgi:ubiquitin conjugation factor E4 B
LQQLLHHAYGRPQRDGHDPTTNPQLAHDFKALHVQDGLLHDPVLLGACLSLAGGMARWLQSLPATSMPHLPAHLLEDLCLVATCAAHAPPDVLEAASAPPLSGGAPSALESLFQCALKFLSAGASLAHAPHLRAKLGDLLYLVFLSPDAQTDRDRDGSAGRAGPQHALLLKHPGAVRDLAPALLDLYGAVEFMSTHDKNTTRVRVSCLLKCLWASEEHRRTFRRVTEDATTFVLFTHALMNETNAHFLTVMEKLPEVRTVQAQMADGASWAALPAAERESIEARLAENENYLRAFLPFCNESIHMIWYLSSDAEIRRPFLSGVFVGRLASMLLSVLVQLVIKGLKVKVNNPEEYSFTPKEMLAKIAQTVCHFADAPAFQAAFAHSAYYQRNPTVLSKVSATCRKHKLVTPSESDTLDVFIANVDASATEARAAEAQMEDAPEHFLDPLLSEVMADPVTLPSGMTIDRATIETHLLNKPTDPFTNQPLSVDQLVPNHALKAEIEAWKASATAAGMSDA